MNREALTRRRRRIATVAALGVTALLLAGCGGNRPGSGPPSPQTTYQQALAYARCVRAHGDPGFPDPNSQGLFPHPAGPQYRSATSACSHLLPSQPLTASQKRQHVVLALKFTACMRSHGYPDFPDPIVKDGGTAIGFGFGHIDQGTPLFHRAIQACRRFEPGLAAQAPGS